MPIPVSTTTITIRSPDAASLRAEPYQELTYTDAATGVRAVIDTPTSGAHGGADYRAGGEQTVTGLRLFCDVAPLHRLSLVVDESNGRVFRVVWFQLYDDASVGLDHIQGEIEMVEGAA